MKLLISSVAHAVLVFIKSPKLRYDSKTFWSVSLPLIDLQIKSDETAQLINKPYANEVYLTERNLY